jgi:hypothetical protein
MTKPLRVFRATSLCNLAHQGEAVLGPRRQPRGAEDSKMESSSRDAEESDTKSSSGSVSASSHDEQPVPKVLVTEKRSQSRHRKCNHGKRKTMCKLCDGTALCKHHRQKIHCKECRPSTSSAYCQHNRQRSRCHLCGGSGICKHGREKYRCKDCRGSK